MVENFETNNIKHFPRNSSFRRMHPVKPRLKVICFVIITSDTVTEHATANCRDKLVSK